MKIAADGLASMVSKVHRTVMKFEQVISEEVHKVWCSAHQSVSCIIDL